MGDIVRRGVITARDGLLLHAHPDKQSTRMDLMPRSDRVELVRSGPSGWLLVKWHGRQGWAASEYIELDPLPDDKTHKIIEWSIIVVLVLVVLSVVYLFSQ